MKARILSIVLLLGVLIPSLISDHKAQANYGIVKSSIIPSLAVKKIKACDPFFCMNGWVYIQHDCHPEYPNTACYYCETTNTTIACLCPDHTNCSIVTGMPCP